MARDGCITNLSERGLGFLAREPYEPGERITLSFSLPGDPELVTMTGRVRWSHDEPVRKSWYRIGLEWTPTDDLSPQQLALFLQRRAQRAVGQGRMAEPLARAEEPRPAPRWPREPAARRWIISSLRTGALLGLAICAALGGRVWFLNMDNRRLTREIQRRNAVISQLELREQRFEQELEGATRELSQTLGDVERLDVQTSQFEHGMQELVSNVEQFRSAYSKAQGERADLIRRILDLERDRAVLVERLTAMPAIQQLIAETIAARQHIPPTALLHQTLRDVE